MRAVFFGTPTFAVPTLQMLLRSGIDVAAVVTQPDRPRSRSHSTLEPSPVKLAAADAGIETLQPDRPRGEEFAQRMRELRADIAIVVAYGHLLRTELLNIPQLGFVNVHASLLPRWRGAAPIQHAILAGDAITGVSIMRIEAGLDSGAVWLQRTVAIDDDDTSGNMFGTLAALGATALHDALPMIAAGNEPVAQADSQVTLAPKIDRDVARIDWNRGAHAVSCHIRAMDPAPGAWTMFYDDPIKLFAPRVIDTALPPGVVRGSEAGIMVGTGSGSVRIDAVQPAGKRRQAAAEWWRGVSSRAVTQFR